MGTKNDARAGWFANFAENGNSHLPRFDPSFLRLGSCNLLSSSVSLYMPISPFIYHGGTRSITHSLELLLLHRHFFPLLQGQVNKEM